MCGFGVRAQADTLLILKCARGQQRSASIVYQKAERLGLLGNASGPKGDGPTFEGVRFLSFFSRAHVRGGPSASRVCRSGIPRPGPRERLQAPRSGGSRAGVVAPLARRVASQPRRARAARSGRGRARSRGRGPRGSGPRPPRPRAGPERHVTARRAASAPPGRRRPGPRPGARATGAAWPPARSAPAAPTARGPGLAGSGSGLNMDEDGGGGGGEGGGGECRRCGPPGWRPGAGVAGAPDGSGAAGPGPGSGVRAAPVPAGDLRRPGARGWGPTGSPPSRSGGPGRGRGRLRPGRPGDSEQGSGVALPGRGTLGATFPASRRQGRPRPPEPDRRRLTPLGVFSQVVGRGVSPGNGEGKVSNWGSSGSKRGGWGDRVENRSSVSGFRSEVVSGEASTRRGQPEHTHFMKSGTLQGKKERSLSSRGSESGGAAGTEVRPESWTACLTFSSPSQKICICCRLLSGMQITVVSCCELCLYSGITRVHGGGRSFGKRRVNTPLTGTPEVEVFSTFAIDLLYADKPNLQNPWYNEGAFWKKKKKILITGCWSSCL